MTIKEMLDMPLNTRADVGDLLVIRVPGGWLYSMWNQENDQQAHFSTFVPEPAEVKECKN